MPIRSKVFVIVILAALGGASAFAVTLRLHNADGGRMPARGNPSGPPPIDPLTISTIAKDDWGSGLVPDGAFLIGDNDTWTGVWHQIHARMDPPPAAPQIDFRTVTVVAAFLGGPQCDARVTIHRVFATEDGLHVELLAYGREPGTVTCQGEVHSYHFAYVPDTWVTATFEWDRALLDVTLEPKTVVTAVGGTVAFRIDNSRSFPGPMDPDTANLTLPSSAPWVIEKYSGVDWVRVERHPEEPASQTVGPGENASWNWTAVGDVGSGLPPVTSGIYRIRLAVDLNGMRFELASIFRLS
jgi:hypothetical protein